MHASGISVDSSTVTQFNTAFTDASTAFCQFNIQKDHFALIHTGRSSSSDLSSRFDLMRSQLSSAPEQPCFIIAPSSSSRDVYQLIFYMPDGSTVRDRMIYAASSSALKDGLGVNFSNTTFAISSAADCTLQNFNDSSRVYSEDEILTLDEKMKLESETSSALAMSSVQTRAIVGLPISANDATTKAISAATGDNAAVILALEEKNEQVTADQCGNWTLEQIQAKLPTSEPRYILHNFSHEHDGKHINSYIFVYYCPEEIKPKFKMFYSTCKQVVMKIVESLSISIAKSIEISAVADLSTAAVLDDLYPATAAKKSFKKPSRPGRGKQRLIGEEGAASSFSGAQ